LKTKFQVKPISGSIIVILGQTDERNANRRHYTNFLQTITSTELLCNDRAEV